MLGHIKRSIKKSSIFRQLVINSLIISIIPMIFGATFVFVQFDKMAKNVASSSYEQIVSQYIFDINEKLTLADARLKHIAADSNIQETLIGLSDETNPILKGISISQDVTKIMQLDSSVDYYNCVIYSAADNPSVIGKSVTSLSQGMLENWYTEDRLNNESGFFYWTANKKTCLLSIIRKIVYVDPKTQETKLAGYIKLDINAKNFFYGNSATGIGNESMYDVAILDATQNIMMSSCEMDDQLVRVISEDQPEDKHQYIYEDKLLYKEPLASDDYYVILLFDSAGYNSQRMKIVMPMVALFMLMIFAMVLLSAVFAQKFTSRITLLVDKMKQIENGDLSETKAIEGNDEIAEIDKDFSRMVKELNTLINRNYIQTLINKEYELKNLQLQINPHFLYNTLESISSMSAVRGNFEICEICEKLGEVFRYSLGRNYGNYVSLNQEIKHIQNYIYIQKTRFEDKFEVGYNIDKQLMNCQILRFILQPIVENAIIHGIVPNGKKGSIEISAAKEDDDLVIYVEDDGIGMSQDTLEKLNEYIKFDKASTNDKTGSIGIKNVNKRIELTCGERYGIVVQSAEHMGSTFIIRLPFIEKEGD